MSVVLAPVEHGHLVADAHTSDAVEKHGEESLKVLSRLGLNVFDVDACHWLGEQLRDALRLDLLALPVERAANDHDAVVDSDFSLNGAFLS